MNDIDRVTRFLLGASGSASVFFFAGFYGILISSNRETLQAVGIRTGRAGGTQAKTLNQVESRIW